MSESREISRLQEFRGTVDAMGAQFLAALPQHVPVEKFKRIVVTAVTMQPELLEADRRTLLASCMKAASDGLLLDNRDAALVIFKTKQDNTWIKAVQYVPMIGGILKRMRQSGEIKSVTAEVVYEHDEFDRWIDESGDHLKHKPFYDGERGEMRLAYSVITTLDGGAYIEVMDRAAIMKVRAVSKTGESENGPWVKWEPEMWRKSVLRRGAKKAPMSTDLYELLTRDDSLTDFNQAPADTTVTQMRPSRPTRLAALAPVTTEGNAAVDADAAQEGAQAESEPRSI